MQRFRVYPSREYLAGVANPRPLAPPLVRLARTGQRRQPDGLVRYQACPAHAGPPCLLATRTGRGRFVPVGGWRRWGTAVLHELATDFCTATNWSCLLLDPLAALSEALDYCCAAQSPAGPVLPAAAESALAGAEHLG